MRKIVTIWVLVVLLSSSTAALSGIGAGDDESLTSERSGLRTTTMIYDVYDLQNMSLDINGTYVLANNIDATSSENWNDGAGFIPVGNLSNPFNGTLDGKGFDISYLFINRSRWGYAGLIGCLEIDARISNLALFQANVSGMLCIGALVGHNNGTVSNCTINSSVCGNNSVGGLVGENHGNILNCKTDGIVRGEYLVGGLVGLNEFGTISNCSGNVLVDGNYAIGGLVGGNLWSISTILNSTCTGVVNGFDTIAGFVGNNGGTVLNSSCNCRVNGSFRVAGFVGINGGRISNCTGKASVDGSNLVGGFAGYNAWRLFNCTSTGIVNGSGDGIGGLIGANYDEIANCTFNGYVKGGLEVGGLVGVNGGGTIKDCASTGSVTGSDTVAGLVGSDEDGTILNCTSNCSANGAFYIGGLMGKGDSCFISNCTSIGMVNGSMGYIGGLVGYYSGTIRNCTSICQLIGYSNSSCGGLVGGNDGRIYDCICMGAITSVNGSSACMGGLVGYNMMGAIHNCAATGSISAISYYSSYIGGLVGRNDGEVQNSFWDNQTTGMKISDGGSGRWTSEMERRATFIGWDFIGIWNIIENRTYPFLRNFRGNPVEPPSDHQPVWTMVPGDSQIIEGDGFNFLAAANDEDVGDLIAYGLSSQPNCAITINSSSGAIIWSSPEVGRFAINLTATDGHYMIWHVFNLTVLAKNHPPAWSNVSQDINLTEGDDFNFTVKATDEDVGDGINYSLLSNPPCGITINSSSGEIEWSNVTRGNYSINLTAYDGHIMIWHVFNINVSSRPPPKHPPVWINVPGDIELNKSQMFKFTAKATDEDTGEVVEYSLSASVGCNIVVDEITGLMEWSSRTAGRYKVVLQASDGVFWINHTFNLTVVDRAPTIADVTGPDNIQVKYNEVLTFSVNATDPDGDNLTYRWTENGTMLDSERSFSRKFAPGDHTVLLLVNDGDQNASQSFNFTVKPAPKPGGTKKGFIGGFEGLMVVAAIVLVLGGYYRKKNGS